MKWRRTGPLISLPLIRQSNHFWLRLFNHDLNVDFTEFSRMPPKKIRQAGLSQLSSRQHNATASSSTSKRKQFFDRVLHPRGSRSENDTSFSTSERKGKKRQASPSPGPSSHGKGESRLVKRVRGGLQTGESDVAVRNAVEVIDIDDDDIQIVGQSSSNNKSNSGPGSSRDEVLQHAEVLNHFRLKPTNVGYVHICQVYSGHILKLHLGRKTNTKSCISPWKTY